MCSVVGASRSRVENHCSQCLLFTMVTAQNKCLLLSYRQFIIKEHFLIPPVDILMVPICSPVPFDSRVRHAHCSSEQTKEAHKDHLCHCTQLICLAQQMGFRGDRLEHYLSFHFHLHTRGIIYSQFPHYSAQHFFSWDCISVSHVLLCSVQGQITTEMMLQTKVLKKWNMQFILRKFTTDHDTKREINPKVYPSCNYPQSKENQDTQLLASLPITIKTKRDYKRKWQLPIS